MASPPLLSVALLQCDHVDHTLRGIAGDYDQMFVRLFAAHAPAVRFERYDVVAGEPPPPLGSHDAVVVSGSRWSVSDDLEWVRGLEGHVRDAHDAGVPLVGVCFGHQLIASALGGRVERASVGWGVGVHVATVTEQRPWMQPDHDRFRLLVSHQDQVVEPPPGARVVATSDHAPVAAMEVGSLLGFQGHPEFVPSYAEALMRARADRIPAATIERARATLDTPTDAATVAGWTARFLTGTR